MPDREKVKKGFERCLSGKMPFGCGKCPYYGDEEYNDAWSCRLSLMRDANELLKEQEATIEILVKDITFHNCNNCNRKDCESKPNAGQPVRSNCIFWLESR